MTRPYVCAACRSLRAQLFIARERRQWLSSSSKRGQEQLYNRTRRPLAAKNEDQEPRGRYSRQPLKPETILDELNTVHRPRTKPTHDQTGGRSDQHSIRLLQRICKGWKHQIIEAPNGVSKDVESLETSSGPLEALRRYAETDSNWRSQTPVILWATSCVLFELHTESAVPRHTILQCIRELMSIWHLAMAAQLQRDPPAASQLQALANDKPRLDWSFLPSPLMFSDFIRQQQRDTRSGWSVTNALITLVPKESPRAAPAAINKDATRGRGYGPSAMLITLDVLRSLQREVESGEEGVEVLEENRPWIQLMEAVLDAVKDKRVPTALQKRIHSSENDELQGHFRDLVKRMELNTSAQRPDGTLKAKGTDWQTFEDMKDMQGVHTMADGSQESPSGPIATRMSSQLSKKEDLPFDGSKMDPDHFRFFGLMVKRFGRITEKQDIQGAENEWKSLQDYVASKSNSGVRIPLGLYEHVLSTFMALRNRATALEIWNHMTRVSEYEPRCKTYTVMMRGCQSMRDVKGSEALWTRMRQKGVRPDLYAWTTRIFGLLKSRAHVDIGFEALREMGYEWIDAARAAYGKDQASTNKSGKKTGLISVSPEVKPSELLATYKGDVDGVTRPAVEVLNASLSALASSNHSLVPKALSWARGFGIELDLRSYNVLINLSMRNGQTEEAINLLRTMQQKGIEANSTTWTVLLSALFEGGYYERLAPAEQEEKVLAFISSLDNASAASIDEKGYALIIDRLLKVYSNNAAAQSVLRHMSDKGVKPSAYIYTILMAFYFEQSPPDLVAVDALWAQIQTGNDGYGIPLDNIFYDRMIEGYAANAHDVGTAPMLQLLARMEKEGKLPSWPALEAAARALEASKEWGRLAQMVETVQRRAAGKSADGKASSGMRYGERSFWNFITSTGLLRNEDVQLPEKITRSQ